MRKQRWPLGCWLVKVAKHRGSSWNHLPVDFYSLQEGLRKSITLLVVSFIQVEIEMTKNFLSLKILNQIHRCLLVPQLRILNVSEFEAKKLLENIHSLFDDMLSWKVLLDLFFIDVAIFFIEDVYVKPHIPMLELSVWVPSLLSLQILEFLEFFLSCFLELGQHGLLEVLDVHWGLGHSNGKGVFRV